MRKMLLISLGLLSSAAFADPQCTTADQSQWQDQRVFQENLKSQGYKIKVFKVTKTNCYEIYGWNKDQKKIEIYFDPVTGNIIKEEIED